MSYDENIMGNDANGMADARDHKWVDITKHGGFHMVL